MSRILQNQMDMFEEAMMNGNLNEAHEIASGIEESFTTDDYDQNDIDRAYNLKSIYGIDFARYIPYSVPSNRRKR